MDSVRFGVIAFEDEIEFAYNLYQPLTNNYSIVEGGILGLKTENRNAEEAYLRVMYESYSDTSIGWEPRARKYLVFFSDEDVRDEEPGRDLKYGTSDDLLVGTVLNKLKEENIVVVLFTSESDLIPYWERDVLSTTGGTAALLSDTSQFAEVVNQVITELSMQIDSLTIEAEPSQYSSWVNAATVEGMEVGAEERTAQFDIEIAVPEGYYTPGTYPLIIFALGDGVPYDSYNINLTIPDNCPRP